MKTVILPLVLTALACTLAGCSSIEYKIRESFGQQKRELLVERVEDAKTSQVLCLKHNLNARAIASLLGISEQLQRDVDVLVADMQKSIGDASRFLEQMRAEETG